MLHTKVNGLSVAYERTGDGPALVLLHGFAVDSRMWRPQIESLSDKFTVIAWDAPGAGQSSDPPETFGIGEWADCLAGILDAAGIQLAHIVGLSWGGILAQEFYRRHSAPVLSLVLADTYAGWKGSLPEPIVEQRLAACLRDASPTSLCRGTCRGCSVSQRRRKSEKSWQESCPTSSRLVSG